MIMAQRYEIARSLERGGDGQNCFAFQPEMRNIPGVSQPL
jgi:hypothetical protein